ncbi:DNA-binding helix-turn-helix protein [[Clostridium] methylpentosum DSM 5476]|uniref:DNA-binding helix-turn-helix protein n=1 Tax=[Clostridium] methylpentosum DSM 5476 TaxID=537013 RepID=C0EJ12_9FIRM|nr:DNA-binding helix-turn-helix protein [[Clostridium] methylpentosum DSM 5476]MDY3989066.1 helix-turn-helix transcriptional regulator [Massilioclostridium sp.]
MKILNAQKTGSLIATVRKEQNRTQQDLANELGVSSAAISKWERGIGFPDVSLIEPLAISLGITIAELFKGERLENRVDHEYESLLSDVVKVSTNEISKKKKITNWIIATTVAVLYLLISIISQKWEITWVVWIVYCFYRIFTEYIYKKY